MEEEPGLESALPRPDEAPHRGQDHREVGQGVPELGHVPAHLVGVEDEVEGEFGG